MAHKKWGKSNGTVLDVFQGRAGRANAAIFEVLARESPQTIKQLLKRITTYEGLEETYYASLTKRLRNLTDTGLIEEMKPNPKGAPTCYKLCVKAILANGSRDNVLVEGSIGELLQATFPDGIILEVVGKKGILRINLAEYEIKKTTDQNQNGGKQL